MFELETCNRPKKIVESCCSNLKKKCAQIKAALKQGIELNAFEFEFGCHVVTSVPRKLYLITLSQHTIQLIYEHMRKYNIAIFRVTCLLGGFNSFL